MKASRQKEMIRIVTQKVIETQAQLTSELSRRGYKATQATISRDIKKLGLLKVHIGSGRYRYTFPRGNERVNVQDRLRRVFHDSVIKVDASENLILIRTLPGTANAVASCIDQSNWEEILGTVAGDDTILVIVRNKERVGYVMGQLESML